MFPDPSKALIYYLLPYVDESVLKHVKTEQSKSLIGVHGQFTQNLSNLKEVCVLDQLTQAHTLLAIMADRSSPEHQQNLLQAYTFVLQIWQVLHHHFFNLTLTFWKSSIDPHLWGSSRV